jgi:hypothetical protein
MNYKGAERLPTLAHPLIGNPAEEVDENKEPLQLPPFPEIDLKAYDGFTLSHLHWVLIKSANPEDWVRLIIRHELNHKHLSLTPFSLLRKHKMFVLYDLILETFKKGKKGQKTISVPLRFNLARNELEKRWAIVVHLCTAVQLVEEVYAVRSSLLDAKDAGVIDHDDLQPLLSRYKGVYGEYIDGFEKAYNAFDFVAGKIGERAAMGLIHSAFETAIPNVTFLDIIFYLCEIDPHSSGNGFRWTLPKKKTHALAGLSTKEACDAFGNLIEEADPDGSRYGRKALLEVTAVLERMWSIEAQDAGNDFTGSFIKFLISPSPTTFLLSYYSDNVHPFALIDLSTLEAEGKVEQKGYYRNHAIFVEAIRQQLTQGRGLLCPFWTSSHPCCGRDYKERLEKVWSCTLPDANCKLWRRMGCLSQ